MIDLRSLLLVPALGLGVSTVAQQGTATPPATPPQSAPGAKAAVSIETLIGDLGSDSYRQRVQAERELRARGKQAVPALEKAAADSRDSEVQWRARRLLRQIEQGGSGVAVERERAGGDAPEPQVEAPGAEARPRQRVQEPSGGDVRDQFERLFERFERDFGLDIPRARFFRDDFFRDLQEQMRGQGGLGTSQGMSMQVGPDGVRVEVQQQNERGEIEKKVYEAPDMESFQKQYPEVLRQNGLGMGLDPLRLPTLRGFDLARPMAPVGPRVWLGTPDVEPAAPSTVPPAGRRLGVTVRPEIPAELRSYLELAADEGLMVEGVQPDSLAQTLGLQTGDIVTRIGEQRIGAPADVPRALGAVKQGEMVTVHFVRKGAEKSASATKTEVDEAADGGAQPAKPRASGRGQVR
ncbi:MAG: PDZ domain-containing protein [Planctomycetes bacterium]|nr:PDZ domain-containing protein [Planctomycetota bacterium]